MFVWQRPDRAFATFPSHFYLRSEERSSMTLRAIIEDTREYLQKEKSNLEDYLRKAPLGTISYSKTKSKGKVYYKWYVSVQDKDGKRRKIYISRENRRYARELAKKRLRTKQLIDVKAQLSAIDSFLAKYREQTSINELLDKPLLDNLLAEEKNLSSGISEELERWAHEEYEMNPKFPEQRNVPTCDGIKVRSKSEAFIVMLLSRLHIPYRYECRLDLGGNTIYPDFTIRHPVTGKYYYWEHVGLLDKPEYRADFLWKMRVYTNNGIYPDYNLILTYEIDDHPFDIMIAQDKIREFFGCEAIELF